MAQEQWRYKPFKSVTRSEVAGKQTMAEASRSYRERIKQDPLKYHEYKMKDVMRKRLKKLTKSPAESEGMGI